LRASPDLVFVDKLRIQQVVFNLVRNAIEATDGIEDAGLCVATAAMPTGVLEVSVADRGRGLSEEAARRLFEPFFTTKRGGTGLGLSISRSIVEAHGGRLWAAPGPDGGTVMKFTLEAAGAEMPDAG